MLRKAKVVGKFVEFFAKAPPPCRSPTARPSPTWRRNTARPWASSRSTKPLPVLRRHRKICCAGRPDPRLLPGAGPVRHPQGGRDRLLADAVARPVDRRALGGWPQAAAGPHRAVAIETTFDTLMQKRQDRRRLRQDRRRPAPHLCGRGRRRAAPRQRGDRRHHLVHQHLQSRVMIAPVCWRRRRRARPLHPVACENQHGPGSRAVTEYLKAAGLLPYLEQLGSAWSLRLHHLHWQLRSAAGGDRENRARQRSGRLFGTLRQPQLRGARAPERQANFLMSPPLVVAFRWPDGCRSTSTRTHRRRQERPVYLKDIGRATRSRGAAAPFTTPAPNRSYATSAPTTRCGTACPGQPAQCMSGRESRPTSAAAVLFVGEKAANIAIKGARRLTIFGDSVTRPHQPRRRHQADLAGRPLPHRARCAEATSTATGARRGNHEVMMRGTFPTCAFKNLMIPGSEGGITLQGGEQKRSTTRPWPTERARR